MSESKSLLHDAAQRVGWWLQGWLRWSWVPLFVWRWNVRRGPYRLGVVIFDYGWSRREP